MILLIAFFLLSIGFSFLCSILEAVILSVTPGYINRLKSRGDKLGDKLALFKEDIDKPLSAILTLNTIAHTVGAIMVGSQAGALYGNTNINLGFTSISAESIVATVMTLAILILSEIIPKTIGANSWKSLVPFTVKVISLLLFVLYPLVWLSQQITKRFKKEKEKSVLSRTDFATMAKESLKEGAIDPSESKIIGNLFQLQKLTTKDIMTPRTVLFSAKSDLTVEEFYQQNKPLIFSRVPIYEDRSDHIIGFVLKDELLEAIAEGHLAKKLKDFRLDINFIEDTKPVTEALDTLIRNKTHIAIVRDQYGSITGLITQEDVFETLLGYEIMDESDKVADLQKLARDLWQKRYEQIKK